MTPRLAVASLIALLSLAAHATAHAAPIPVTSRAALAGDDAIEWGTLGSPLTTVPNPAFVSSAVNAIAAAVSMPAGNFMTRRQSSDWFGAFAPGADLLWTMGGPGPLVITFGTPVAGAGAQIQPDAFGAFTARLAVFDTTGSMLSMFELTGESTGAADDSAPFLGIRDTAASIGRIEYAMVMNGVPDEFAINRLDLVTMQQMALAQPGTLPLLGAALLVLLGIRLRNTSAPC